MEGAEEGKISLLEPAADPILQRLRCSGFVSLGIGGG